MTKNNLISMVDFPKVTKNVKEKEGKKNIRQVQYVRTNFYVGLRLRIGNEEKNSINKESANRFQLIC